MTIRKKTLLIIFAITLSMVLLLYGISETFFLGNFADLEYRMALENVDRAQLALSSDIDQLNSTARDWANWNETYIFMTDRNQNYISANLNADPLSNLRLNLILFVDSSGDLVFARMVDYETKREMPIPERFLKDLFRKGTLVCRNESDTFKGIILLPEGPMLISSRPILTSEGTGPVRGTLIMGRYLDLELKHLSELTQLPLVSQIISDSNMSSDFAAAKSSFMEGKSVLAIPSSENSIAGYALIKDIYGDPALILRVDMPRDIYHQGQSAVYYFSIYILLIGLVFAILILFLLERTILSRIARLILDVRNIGLSGDTSMRIPAAGNDELSKLSGNINDMLDKIDQSEKELRRSKERLASLHQFQDELLDTAAIWIDMFDSKGNMIFWNLAAERISGYSREEVLGNAKIWEWLYPDSIARSEMIDSAKGILMRNERLENFETIISCKNGDKRVIRWHSNNFVDEAGKNMGGIGIGADITEHKKAEEALKDSKRHLADIINFLPDPTAVIDKDGKVISWNKAMEDMTGVKAEDILGKGDYEYAIPFYGQRRPVLIDMVIKPPKELEANYSRIKRQGGALVGESYSPNLNGGEAYLLGTAAALYDSTGNIVGAIESVRDITERKRAEEALRESEERYRNVVERANDGIIIIQDDLIKYANSRTGMMWDSTVEEIIDKSFTDYIYPDEIPMLVDRYRRRMANEYVEPTYETTLRRKDGSKILVEISAGLIKYKGRPADLVIVRDISERKQAEEALSRAHSQLELKVEERTSELETRNAEMERFVYTVSHDLRTPLISLSGLLGLLKQDVEKGDMERTNADLRMANEAVAKMDQLLMETLELSRIGRIVNPPEDVPFGEIVKDALDLVAGKVHAKNVKILERKDWPVVKVDRMRISEVLVNLIENSLKYMGDQPNPEIELGHRLDGDETVFFVRDNGIGIDPSQNDKVFGLFYKIEKKSEGTGAGLTIVKRIIEVHGGRIWIESEPGKGCMMCFTLPLA